ncbi:hypothetical protein HA402_008752 [Bradysia odoriphaga]|nr:hypothetical protein HA402_008752 [Bradysia odoriphaga]
MGADANSQHLVNRHRSAISSKADEKLLNEDAFDNEITTLNSSATDHVMSANLSHEKELEKLKEIGAKTPILPSEIGTDFNFKREIVWPNAIGFLLLHLCALVGVVITLLGMVDIRTTLYGFILIYGSGLGITMGAHRLWSHRSFKAKLPLKIFLLWLHTLAGQNCLYVWVRDHRQHHKYSDTDADPHNANRGFFFSHVGWLMSRKHPKVIEYGKKIDMSDLEADPWIMFQKRHYKVLYTIFSLWLPTMIPCYFWGEDPVIALFAAFFARTVIQLNATWLVNSAAHLYGTRPFDKSIKPVESMFVAFFAVGEGWHNYHHAFPWDYRASELGSPLNITGFLIDLLAQIGQVYDRKEATHNMVKNRVLRTGDKSHKVYGTDEGRRAITTLFNIWKHPSNPTYNSLFAPKPKIINSSGYALIPDELAKSEMDEDLLSRENEQLEKEQLNCEENNNLIVKLTKFMGDGVGGADKSVECNNNVTGTSRNCISRDKSELNVDEVLLVKL